MITVIRVCRKCGAKIFSDAPEGLCTRCVLETALRTLPEDTVVPTRRDDPVIQNWRADSLIGETIGHYKISEPIGTGGMGEVYLATDIVAGRKAALKLLPMRFTGDAERLKRFHQEAHAVVGLNHPNILTVYEIGEDHSIHYIASELIEGETLRQRLMRGRMQLSEAIDIAIQVASALAAAHQAGIVHRDIKPENVMLRPDGYVKVLDFGIAKLAEQEVPVTIPRDEALLLVETNLGSVLGTVRYMSPEQACGAQVDKSTDIWSLGVVLYEMVTGHVPFTGDTPREVMSAILESEPPPLTRYIAHPPAELQQIISKTLRKDRKKRYRSAHDLLKALKDLRRKLEFESFFMSGFFDEVKQRKVYRVAAAYIIVAAGIIQLASAAFPAWELPNSAVRLVIVLLLIGFPLALIFGWAFDLTPQGIRVTPRAPPGTHRRRNVIMLVATGVMVSAVAGFFLLPRGAAHKIDKSIAVLPFENLSEEKANAYFAEGIKDEILTKLATVRDLKVISRTSTAKYQSKPDNLKSVAQELGVSTVLEGAVQKAGDKVRVNVQLIDARANRHLWAKSYDRDLKDVLAVESEVSQEIAEALQANLSSTESHALASAKTRDAEAYDLFLRGESEWHQAESRLDVDAYDRTEGFYRQALARDPNFAEASAGLARIRLSRHWNISPLTSPELEEAKSIIDHSLALAPNSPEAHFALGFFFYYGRRQYENALTEFNRALELQPNNALARQWCAYVYRRRGEWERSLADFQRAQELDPRDAEIPANIGSTYMELRLWKDAERAALRALGIDPQNTVAAMSLLLTSLCATGDVDSARRALDGFPEAIKGLTLSGGGGGASWGDWGGGVASIIGMPVYLDVMQRRFTDAFQALKKRVVNDDRARVQQLAGRAALRVLAGETDAAKSTGEEALPLVEARLRARPDDTLAMTELSWVYLALGRNTDALRLSRQAADSMSIEKDALAGPSFQNGLAQIEARAGAAEEAIKRLRHLLSIPAGGVASIALLKIDPVWDPIRNRPDFQQLLSGPEQIGPGTQVGPAAAVSPEPATIPEKSIAVLPFVNMSPDKENEYLSDGITEDLCTALGQIRGLHVPARTSSFAFKGRTEDIVFQFGSANAMMVSFTR
jgi:TolB-like protein/Tfp pilus assembly protein PilF